MLEKNLKRSVGRFGFQPRIVRRRLFSGARLFSIFNFLFILLIFWFSFRPGAFRPSPDSSDLAFYRGQKITFRGRVCREAEVGFTNRRLTVCAPDRVLITTDLYPAYDYGDFLEVSGFLQAPQKIEDFDYERYLARYDIYSLMYYPQIRRLEDGPLLSGQERAYRRLLDFKQELSRLMKRALPEPAAGLAGALLLGYRRGLYPETSEIFARIGLSHIVAISGTHISILGALALNFWLALGLHRRQALVMTLAFLFIYPFITGLSASAIRAAIMGGLAFLAVYYQRPASSPRVLLFAAALMLAFNPRLLRADLGFQLSFLALLGIIYFYPLGEAWTNRLLEGWRLKHDSRRFLQFIFGAANLTLAAQAAVLPIILLNFKQLSLIAPLSNILIIWTLPLVLTALVFALAASAVFPAGSVFFFAPAYFILKFILDLAAVLAAPSWAAIQVEGFSCLAGLLYYLGLILLIRFLKIKNSL